MAGSSALVAGWAIPVNSFYRTSDQRWVCYNGAYPHLRDGILRFLDCANTTEALARASAKLPGREIEDGLAESGLCGSCSEPPPNGGQTSRGRALLEAGVTPVQLTCHEGSPPARLPQSARPLDGVRVIDMTHVVAGPAAGRQLAEQGADVINIRHPYQPFLLPVVLESGCGKRNIFLDYTRGDDRAHLINLIRDADVLLHSYRPDSLARAGLSVAQLRALNPALVLTRLDAHGFVGPSPGIVRRSPASPGIARHRPASPGIKILLPN